MSEHDFAVPLPEVPGMTVSDEPFDLDAETRAEVNRRLDDIDRCRAQAAASARDYVVFR